MQSIRQNILTKAAWQPFLGHPALERLGTPELEALDSLFEHIGRHSLARVVEEDVLAWAELEGGRDGLASLLSGIAAFDPNDPSIAAILAARTSYLKKLTFEGTSSKGRAPYERRVSVPVNELPARWQEKLTTWELRRKSGDPTVPAMEIQKRMRQKLGQYIFSVRRAGLSEDLHIEGLRAFHADLTSRGNIHTSEPLRPATLRATFEELERFARLSDLFSAEIMSALRLRLDSLSKKEALTRALKESKLHGVGGPADVLRKAFDLLESVAEINHPARRHIRRNRAAAIGLQAILPIRREWDRIIFGETLFWDGGRYRFREFTPGKTAHHSDRREFPGSIHPGMSVFVNGLILHDNYPKYLEALRQKAEFERRPLFVQPKGNPCSKNYVTRVWRETFGLGAHGTRTLVHDFFGRQGDEGVRKALILCDQYGRQTAEHYTTASQTRLLLEAAQDELEAECQELDE